MSFTLTFTEKTSKIYLSPSQRLPPPDETQIPTVKELHSWTFSAESIAACTIHDVLNMRKNEVDNYDFFWLGRVPCRSVKIVGMVVGIQVYERKITYTVDDGTGVVDCVHLHRPAKSPPEIILKYKYTDATTPLEPFNPVAEMGQTVRVTGNIRPQYDTRAISINQIDQCPSPNEELLHYRLVQGLRRTSYSSQEPFVIPKRPEKSKYDSPPKTLPNPPTTIIDLSSSVPSSPVKSSPIKDDETTVTCSSPPKLRHPSRLHTHDLTENTFRIYVKHYMDNAANTLECDSDIMIQTCLEKLPKTPTKRSWVVSPFDVPRQSYHDASLATPKGNIKPYQKDQEISTERPNHEGFTISYLRRVPELSLLAYRVVRAVANRREREERKRSKDVISSRKCSPTSSVVAPDKFAGKMKRLFQWAVIQLLREGCIILEDGPGRPLPASEPMITDTSQLWKTKPHGTPVPLADDKFFGSDSRSLNDHPMLGYISDPQPDEESYSSLTPACLSEYVRQAVQFIVKLQADRGKPYAGATAEGILSVLKKDDRWRYIGLWNIQDALDFLRDQGEVWDLGKGRWDLTD